MRQQHHLQQQGRLNGSGQQQQQSNGENGGGKVMKSSSSGAISARRPIKTYHLQPSLNNSGDPAKRTYSVIQHNNGHGTPRTRRRNEAAKKSQARPSSKSFRSFPPVPIPKKSRRCQEILPQDPTTSSAATAAASATSQLFLQPPDLKREGSWRKLKRKLTPSKRKPEVEVAQDKANQLVARPEAGFSGTTSNDLKDGGHNQIPKPHRKETLIIIEPCEEEEKENLHKPLIEADSLEKNVFSETRSSRVPSIHETSSVSNFEGEVAECSPHFVKNVPEASSTAFNLSSSSSSSDNEPEPYTQLVDVDNTSTTTGSVTAETLEGNSDIADRPLPPAYPHLMDSAMTQSAYVQGNKKGSPAPGSMSVRTTRRLRFKMPQASVCSNDSFRGIDENRANSMGDMTTAGHSSSITNLNHSSELGISSLQGRRVTLQGVEYEAHNHLSPTRPNTLERPIASTPSSPIPSPIAPRRGMTDVEKRRASLAVRRQSNVQLIQKACGRRTSTTLIPLTSAQIHLVRSLWRQIYLTKGPTVIGTTVMHRLFFKCPKLKEQFRNCPMPRCFSNHDSFAKSHCKAMAELVDQVVESLDDLDNVTAELQRVGKLHAQLLSGQLSSKLWNSVAETFIDCTLEWGDRRCRSETVRKAWALIIAFMVEKIKHGHLEARKQLLVMRSTIAGLERVALNASSTATATANIKI
uniref:Globin family profile domain-containing protein n=1 Tax=Ditylenchus dipsaci TaxID=166011 RepID=A0A915E297_9BILA